MKILTRVSLVLIAIPLVITLWTSLDMILFVQPERAQIEAGTLRYMFSYENFVHEAGFARLALAIIGLLILFIPYRKGERWALAALAVLIFVYQFPVFFLGSIPTLGTWPIFRRWPQPRASGLAMVRSLTYFPLGLSLAGLAIAMPRFLRRRDTGVD
jgi:hypothetical protein